jgi:hypothetical protein
MDLSGLETVRMGTFWLPVPDTPLAYLSVFSGKTRVRAVTPARFERATYGLGMRDYKAGSC